MIPQPYGEALLSLAECAALLNMSRADLANRHSRGTFIDKVGDLGKRSPAFRRSDALAWDRARPKRGRPATATTEGDAEGLGKTEPTPSAELESPTLNFAQPDPRLEVEPELGPAQPNEGDAEGLGKIEATPTEARMASPTPTPDGVEDEARKLLAELEPALKRYRRAHVIAKDPEAYGRMNLALALRIAGHQLSGARSKMALDMERKLSTGP